MLVSFNFRFLFSKYVIRWESVVIWKICQINIRAYCERNHMHVVDSAPFQLLHLLILRTCTLDWLLVYYWCLFVLEATYVILLQTGSGRWQLWCMLCSSWLIVNARNCDVTLRRSVQGRVFVQHLAISSCLRFAAHPLAIWQYIMCWLNGRYSVLCIHSYRDRKQCFIVAASKGERISVTESTGQRHRLETRTGLSCS